NTDLSGHRRSATDHSVPKTLGTRSAANAISRDPASLCLDVVVSHRFARWTASVVFVAVKCGRHLIRLPNRWPRHKKKETGGLWRVGPVCSARNSPRRICGLRVVEESL